MTCLNAASSTFLCCFYALFRVEPDILDSMWVAIKTGLGSGKWVKVEVESQFMKLGGILASTHLEASI